MSTTFIRDMSHYDTNLSLDGYAGTTHKITEGTGYVDPQYAHRMPGFRASARVLGSYHVLRSADPAGQLQFWIQQQDKLTPWWRDWPHWIMQVDAEKWPDDAVSASTVLSFAKMLKAANLPGLQVCYASRGQFGDSLNGIVLDLWNAAYRSSTYPGDDSSAWDPYSGKTPVFWQYTSTPYDKNAFRGTVAELLAYIEGGDMTVGKDDLTAIAQAVASKLYVDYATATSGLAKTQAASEQRIIKAVTANVQTAAAAITAAVGAIGTTTVSQEQLNTAVYAALKQLAAGA